MNTTRTRAALRMFQRSRSPVAALPFVFLIATLFGISPIFASTSPRVAQGTSRGGFSSASGMYPPDPRAPAAPGISDLSATGLPADLGTPSGGFSSAPGMYSSDSSAASTGSGTYADYLALLRAKREGGATAKFGAVHKPYPL